MTKSSIVVGQIELRVEHLASLFDALDPFPTPTRDLAPAAEDFISSWAREFPDSAALRLVIHVPPAETKSKEAAAIRGAIVRHFTYRAERVRGDLKEMFRYGRRTVAIGLLTLAVCVLAGRFLAGTIGDTYVGRFFSEGLIIVGWVANWRPLEIFLYDWWPLRRRRQLFYGWPPHQSRLSK